MREKMENFMGNKGVICDQPVLKESTLVRTDNIREDGF
jgi:hypothetical protein